MKNKNQMHCEKDGSAILFTVEANASTLKTIETPFGVKLELDRFKSTGEPGAPALPTKVLQVALPLNATDIVIETEVVKSLKLFKEPVVFMPVPRPRLAASKPEKQRPEYSLEERYAKVVPQKEHEAKSIPSDMPLLVPDADRYNAFYKSPKPFAVLTSTVVTSTNVIANIEINPVTVSQDFIPVLQEQVKVKVTYKAEAKSKATLRSTIRSFTTNPTLQQSFYENLRESVINPRDIIDITRFPWEIFGSYNYIVITDNKAWDSDKIEPTTDVGDMVSAFQKLVDWKKEKGLKARVVTITDIVGGRFGDFKTGAVDLQEVLRNFLKHAHTTWGVTWCLLGGDTEIVPIREVAGEMRGDVNIQATNNPPQKNEAYWTGTFVKIYADSLGEWFSCTDSNLKLTSKTTGRLIPKKAPRRFNFDIRPDFSFSHNINLIRPIRPIFETTEQFRNRLGWYFCTDDTYTTYSEAPTPYVRVDGASSIINAPMRFHYTWNTIPTDFYYSSLLGPNYNVPGKRDWDHNNNKLYGQHEHTNKFDPINWNADVIVGRAPASTPAQAQVFVNKVVSYEKFRREDGSRLDRNYIDKMLLVAENWGGRLGLTSTATNPPQEGRFFVQPANNRSILRIWDNVTLDWNWQLISKVSDTDVRLIPYNRNASASNRGWYYAVSPTDLRESVLRIPLPWHVIEFPLISKTIVVYGDAGDINPSMFILDVVDADGSMMDQEHLRQQVDTELAFVHRFNRLYEDIESLPLSNRLAAPLSRLTRAELEAQLNSGQHFVSLSGHGNMYGCCMLDNSLASALTNRDRHFILFADSCLTNAYTTSDAMAEQLLNNPNGGAVAYVGHTRFSWIGYGDDYQRAFFNELTRSRHLGVMHSSRLRFVQAEPHHHVHIWSVLALNLLGDPEMEVWTRKPYDIFVDIRFINEKLYIKGFTNDFVRKMLPDLKITALQGEKEIMLGVDENGAINVDPEWLRNEKLRLRVASNGSLPVEITSADLQKALELNHREEQVGMEFAEAEERQKEVISIPIQTLPSLEAKITKLEEAVKMD